jgi:hypothetical protein
MFVGLTIDPTVAQRFLHSFSLRYAGSAAILFIHYQSNTACLSIVLFKPLSLRFQVLCVKLNCIIH